MTAPPRVSNAGAESCLNADEAETTLVRVEALARGAANGPDIEHRQQLYALTPAIDSALAWASAAPVGDEALARLVVAMVRTWSASESLGKYACWADRAAALPLPAGLGLKARLAQAYVDFIYHRDYTRAHERAAVLRDETAATGSDSDFVFATMIWAACVFHAVDPQEVVDGILAALDRAADTDAELRCQLLTRLGGVCFAVGQHARGAEYLEQARSLAVERGLQRAEAFVLVVLGEVARAAHVWTEAVQYLERVTEIDAAAGSINAALGSHSSTTTCANLANALCRLGRFPEAATWTMRGLDAQSRSGTLMSVDCLLLASGGILSGAGMFHAALRIIAAADSFARATWEPADRIDFDTYRAHLIRTVPADEWEPEWRAGADLPVAGALDLARQLLPEVARQRPAEPLSAREREVLELVAAGCANRDIAETLVIGVRTVESHVASICGKLGVRTRAQAAARAIATGIASPANRTALVAKCEALHDQCCAP